MLIPRCVNSVKTTGFNGIIQLNQIVNITHENLLIALGYYFSELTIFFPFNYELFIMLGYFFFKGDCILALNLL
jgi:hypothetical protein